MTIAFQEIPPEGMHLEYDLSGAFAAKAFEGTEVDIQASTIRSTIDLHRTGDEAILRGNLAGQLVLVCSRCLQPAKVELFDELEALFVPGGTDRDGPESTDGDDLDDLPNYYHYHGGEIDLAETLREELLLEL